MSEVPIHKGRYMAAVLVLHRERGAPVRNIRNREARVRPESEVHE